MNKHEKEIAKTQLSSEEKTLKELQQVFKKARQDVQEKISELNSRQDMQNLQSIIYQKKYQQAILDQINEALADLKSGQYKTVEDFLVDSYDNGYIGMMYSLQSQGIPMTIPINDRNVVRALTTDSKLSSKYYQSNPLKGRLAENVDLLKQRVRSNLSRGIIAGKSWLDVAVDIASGMNNPFDIALRDAMRIVRTEGHRVHQQGFLDAGDKAKDKGADILKQWDATMDSKTRPAHQQADGQIVEWDDYFSVGGEKMKAPSVGGSAKNVCNCRCQLLQRARWALDESELETLQKRAEYFGLDKSESFENYKQKYLKLPEKADGEYLIPKVDIGVSTTKDFQQLTSYMKGTYGVSIDKKVELLDFETVKDSLEGVEWTLKQFPSASDYLKKINVNKKGGVMNCTGDVISFNAYLFDGHYYSGDHEFFKSTGVHESTHMIEGFVISKMTQNKKEFAEMWNSHKFANSVVKQAIEKLPSEITDGKKRFEILETISSYASTNSSEALAEAMSDIYKNGNSASSLSLEIFKLLKEIV